MFGHPESQRGSSGVCYFSTAFKYDLCDTKLSSFKIRELLSFLGAPRLGSKLGEVSGPPGSTGSRHS